MQQHKLHLSNLISAMHNNTVAYGPFKGLKFINESHWGGADKGTMILGLYEQEILGELVNIPNRYEIFIDLGAADGYYGIGVLINGLFKKSYCFEITDTGRNVIQKNTALNKMEDAVVIRGEATQNFINEIPKDEIDRSVLFVDIEGGEFDLFNRQIFSSFSNSIIFIELHDFFFSDGDKRLHQLMLDSSHTHFHKFFKMGARDLSVFKELEGWNDMDRWLVCAEGRPRLMTWVRFDPVAKNF